MQKTQDELFALVEQAIVSMNWKKEPTGLYDPIEYVLSLGGKRLRPVLALMACNLYTDDLRSAVNPAIALEVFHNFTLLHDDIMDKADTRRGKPTVHKRWNDNTAILSGDAMLIEAYKLIADCPPNVLKKILDVFSQTALEVCDGQQYDMEFETRTDVAMVDYIEMIRLKTAVLLAGSLKIGAIIGGANDQDANCLYNFGINIGLAFQLRDDYLDVFGDKLVFGKNIGGDILANKKTFLLIEANSLAQAKTKAELENWVANNDPKHASDKITAITEIYKKTGVDFRCEEKMNFYFNESVESIKNLQCSDNKYIVLLNFAKSLLYRKK